MLVASQMKLTNVEGAAGDEQAAIQRVADALARMPR
jgi:hypothetical protein